MVDHDADNSRALFESATHGDVAAVDDLIERHLPALQAYVRLNSSELLLAKESHTDLVQSACRELLGDLEGVAYQSERQFRRWLYTAALSKIKNKVRYHAAAKRATDREIAPVQGSEDTGLDLVGAYRDFGTPSEDAMAREHVGRIESVFASLPEDQREVLTLSRIVGLSYAEIAEHLGKSEVNIRKLYSRAFSRIVRLLDDD